MNKRYFELARIVATSKKDKRNFLLGAVGIRNDGIIVCSPNGPTKMKASNHRGYFPEAHAEFRVSRKLDVGSVIYVIRLRRGDKKVCLAKPCKTCRTIMRYKGVRKVYYSVSENEKGIVWDSLIP